MEKRFLIVIFLVAILLTGLQASSGLFGRVSAFDPGGPPPAGQTPTVVTGNWEMVNYGPNGGSYSPQNDINQDNVEFLELKWIFPFAAVTESLLGGSITTGSGAPPLIVDGIVYTAKNAKVIHALDAKTGEEVWYQDHGTLVDIEALQGQFPYFASTGGHVHAMNYYREQGWLIMSTQGCHMAAYNIEDGSLAWEMFPEQLCGTVQEMGIPGQTMGTFGNIGFLGGRSNPPAFDGDTMIFPAMGRSGRGGRSSVIGFDISDPQNPEQLWRTWLSPHMDGEPNWAIDQCDLANGNGWYLDYPRYLEGVNFRVEDGREVRDFLEPNSGSPPYLATNCRDVPDEVVRNDWINMEPGTPRFGKVHTASSIAAIWGHMPLDPETGIIYIGTGDIGPYPNSTFKYGPNLHGSGIVALDTSNGDLVWWFADNPHDLWDQDCSWNGMLGQAAGIKVLFKGCKNGHVLALNAATGEPVWVWDPPNVWRSQGSWQGVGWTGDPSDPRACCRMTQEGMSFQVWGGSNADFDGVSTVNCSFNCLEADIAYDGKHVYAVNHNLPRIKTIGVVREFGNNGQTIQSPHPNHPANATLWAIDANTGKPVWEFFIDGNPFRGGVLVTGGVVYVQSPDGNLYMLDDDTGELLNTMSFGVSSNVMPTVGRDSDGNHKIFMYIGGRSSQGTAEGSLAAFGLPDILPEPEVIEIEVPGPEVIVEVPGPEVIVEVPGPEVIVEVPGPEVATISPISYVAIGLGVVLIVIAGVLFTRRRSIQ